MSIQNRRRGLRRAGVLIALATVLAACTTPATSQAPGGLSTSPVDGESAPAGSPDSNDFDAAAYFEGKTITLIAASSPGGGTDTAVRTIAKHLTQYIPGEPNIIVQNMSGAGGIIANNFICNVAEPDGLTWNASTQRSNLYAQIQGNPQMTCDQRDLTWIGNSFKESDFLILRVDSGFTSIDAIKEAPEPPKLGAQSTTDASYISARVAEEALGISFEHVLGYGGSEEVVLDIERGALDGRFGSPQQLEEKPEWLEDGIMNLLFTTAEDRLPEYPDVPTLTELTPPEQQDLMIALYGPATLSRSFSGPPGVPPEIVAVMREAYAEMSQSAEFVQDLEEARFVHFFQSGETVQERMEALLGNERVTTLLKDILGEPEADS